MIVVSGASRGLGAAIRAGLIADGEEVVGLARSADPAADILACDVSDHGAVKAAMRAIKARKRPVTALVNAAGIASMNLVLTTPEAVMRRVVETNLLGTMFLNQQVAPLLIRAGGGSIVNFSTIAVTLGLRGEAAYVASKAGVEGFSRAFAREVADFGVRVNCIAPGPIRTDLLKGITDAQIAAITEQQVIRRAHEPEEVVDLVRTLLAPGSRAITGQVIHVGGA
ncbi:SDR family oxidoreductase [Paralimibaculum aggregatum]|uniref:SDR family oxidoreductase n=1 Tax=Paralimibaculum aggregatum TaxID=3036245 RepID=A0ABQ6LIU8_9RHOB|nr:SDR family oxidoreductase [Limibaculum sp. NKW23]GMG82160.1 SDR family oxidoreductase [Limibaculum sp. NKW23]